MRASYCDGYSVPLPEGHPFPMAKFPALHRRLLHEGLLRESDVVAPRPADWADLLRVHTSGYLSALAEGTLSKRAVRRMGLPWSGRLVRRSRLAVQGTVNAALMALEDGVAVAVRLLRRSRWIERALIVDLDVHQGNGNAAFFADTEAVFTFSLHGADNYPFEKPLSSLDVGLPDDTGDAAYLDALKGPLPGVLAAARPDLVFYLGGIDVTAGDRYGRLGLSREGRRARERYALTQLEASGAPVVLLLSGGYADTPDATADLHAEMHRAARAVFG